MVLNHMESVGKVDADFAEKLVDWANITRVTFNEGAIDELIATRRLVHIVRAFAIFNDKMKAINLCINRFDDVTRQSFSELYEKIDAGVAVTDEDAVSPTDTEKEDIPF